MAVHRLGVGKLVHAAVHGSLSKGPHGAQVRRHLEVPVTAVPVERAAVGNAHLGGERRGYLRLHALELGILPVDCGGVVLRS